MAQKYGGQYSPNGKGTQSASQKPSQKSGLIAQIKPSLRKSLGRLKLYRILATFIGVAGLFDLIGNPIAGLISIGSFFAILLATEITKAGIEAEDVYDQRSIARAPAFPRKLIGVILIGLIFLIEAKFAIGADWGTAIGVALAGGIGMVLCFGLDPMRAKGLHGENSYEAGRAADAIERAQKYLDEIRAMSKGLPDRRARLEVESLALSAEDMFRALEDDPGDYRNSRRYLGVYLQGARDATSQFLQLPKSEQSAEAEAKYLALIRELDEGFRQKRETILQDNRNTLNIEIDVLRDRLASEGIKIPKEDKS